MTSDRSEDDSIYYRDGASNKLSMSLLRLARQRMFNLFMSEMKPGPSTTILDIGVSDAENEGANFLEKSYPWPAQITCAGLGDGRLVRETYTDVNYVQIKPHQKLPFKDKQFDISYSNAVIEHVGGSEERRNFLTEHLRVARNVFLAVPNRWFFVEHHTGIPLLHYLPGMFRRMIAGTHRDYWSHVSNVDFIGPKTLRTEWPIDSSPKIVMTGINLGAFSSNIALIYIGDSYGEVGRLDRSGNLDERTRTFSHPPSR